jgi:hypothetical protein
VDSDDYLEKEALHILHEYAEKQNSEILYFNKSIIYEDNLDENKEPEYNEKLNYTEIYTGKELFVEFMHRNIYKSINAYTQFFRTDFLKQHELHFYNGIVHEDYLFYFQCAMKAKRVANIDKQLYVYRKRAQSITTKFEEINKMSVCLVWIELLNYWKNNSFTHQEDRAMEKFADLVYRQCQTYIKLTNSGHKMELGTAADKYIYNRWTQNQFVDFSDEELNQIKKASSVWIYGAGDVGNEVALVLEKSNISITGYIVSDKSKSRQKVWGWTVYQLDEITRHSDDVFIIASIRYPTEMGKNLLEMGVKNIIYAAKSEKWQEDIT